ncbi:hypothetical protein TNCV_4046291 [Trichonephila clavipes]|nr:hypothetical protein TNCV_4046291 [Trichonephila clavipes]
MRASDFGIQKIYPHQLGPNPQLWAYETDMLPVAFSPGGHVIALTENGDIHLHYSVGFKRLASFKKNNGKVLSHSFFYKLKMLHHFEDNDVCQHFALRRKYKRILQ